MNEENMILTEEELARVAGGLGETNTYHVCAFGRKGDLVEEARHWYTGATEELAIENFRQNHLAAGLCEVHVYYCDEHGTLNFIRKFYEVINPETGVIR